MAKRTTKGRTEQPQPEWTKCICDDCGHGSWIMTHSNMDWQKKPICLTCPYKQFHILRGAKACEHWKNKPKEADK